MSSVSSKILVTEDDPSFQRYLSFILDKEGYTVVVATNGLQGLRMAKEEKPDLIILDVMLPGLDGFEICHRIRTDPATSHLPVLILSAKGQDSDRETALAGCDSTAGRGCAHIYCGSFYRVTGSP